MPIVLGYWNIRGVAQPIRLLLAYADAEFEDKHYETGPAPDYNRESWLQAKARLDLLFPSLPYLIDGDIKLTQTNAILRHLARKFNLDGVAAAAKARVDMLENVLTEFRNASVRLFYNPMFEKLKTSYLKELSLKLQQFERILTDSPYLADEKLTFIDFILYELLDQHRELDSTCLKGSPNLTSYCSRIEELPNIKKYMASERFLKSPINNKNAKFSTGEEETLSTTDDQNKE